MAQKQISNRIEFGQNLNPLKDYAGVPSINDDGNIQTLIDKVDKVSNFWKNQLRLVHLMQTLYLVNNFFCRWFTDIDIKRYPDDLRILPTDKTIEIHDYAEGQLKYLPDNSLKKIKKSFL